jgi:hypothetical protein
MHKSHAYGLHHLDPSKSESLLITLTRLEASYLIYLITANLIPCIIGKVIVKQMSKDPQLQEFTQRLKKIVNG